MSNLRHAELTHMTVSIKTKVECIMPGMQFISTVTTWGYAGFQLCSNANIEMTNRSFIIVFGAIMYTVPPSRIAITDPENLPLTIVQFETDSSTKYWSLDGHII